MTLSVPVFDEVRVAVIGDLMLDRYWFGSTARISPEAPVPVVRVGDVEERPGGAANVAVNLASVGVRTVLVGLTGEDEAARDLERILRAQDIVCDFARMRERPTITKLRVISRNQQLIRLDFEQDFRTPAPVSLMDQVRRALAASDVVVLSDYAKGTLHEAPELIAACRTAGVPVLVDPKGGSFEPYRGATMITPNATEFQAVAGPCADEAEIRSRGRELCRQLELEAVLITRSERGMLLLRPDGAALDLPAEAREVYDVTGAGDTVIALLAAGLGAGRPMEEAAALANLAAGLVVGKLGVAAVTTSELRHALHRRGIGGRSLVSEARLGAFVRQARLRGESVIFTNGCFDILHAGHVAYLEEAKTLGDRLIVAVNDDDSVRRLKGAGRPINPLGDRMAVLAGLAAVDWVMAFSEDTPARLIESLRPDVLVKGGDYTPDEIAGADSVRGAGGRVVVLDFHEGRSTSAIIETVRKA